MILRPNLILAIRPRSDQLNNTGTNFLFKPKRLRPISKAEAKFLIIRYLTPNIPFIMSTIVDSLAQAMESLVQHIIVIIVIISKYNTYRNNISRNLGRNLAYLFPAVTLMN